jgi:chromosomal replication initiation ATPase DnaA
MNDDALKNNGNLEQILVERHLLSQEQLASAQQLMQLRKVPFAEALVELKLMNPADIQSILADLQEIRALKLEDIDIDFEATRHVPALIAHRHRVIPVRRSGNTLAVAMVDPTDSNALTALCRVTDFEIVPFLARLDAVEHALYLHYGEPPVCGDDQNQSPAGSEARQRPSHSTAQSTGLNQGQWIQPHYNFGALIEDPGNQFPLGIARTIASGQYEDGYNPFHYYGGAGSGKTHLLHAIANYVTNSSPFKRLLLISGRQFCDNLFESIRDQRINFFRYLYRELDVLLIDDAEPILMQDWAQSELLETFSILQKTNKQLVLTSRCNLATEPRLSVQLRHCLESGVIASIGNYSAEAKIQILKNHAGNAILAADIYDRIVQRCGDNVDELLTTLEQVVVLSMIGEQPVTSETVETIATLMRGANLKDHH